MKIFIDTGDLEEIREANALGLLDGVTTNPTLVKKAGKRHEELIAEICAEVEGHVSAEVTELTCEKMVEQGKHLAAIAENVVVKLPLIPEGIKACKRLTEEHGIKINVTLCFSANQALVAAKAGAYYISPFVGRLDDIAHEGMDLIADIREIYDNYGFETEILTASARSPMHFLEAAKIGSDVITAPHSVLMSLMKHPLTDIGLDRFMADFRASQKGE
jgi:transaldolase